jgi:hypothetical protein
VAFEPALGAGAGGFCFGAALARLNEDLLAELNIAGGERVKRRDDH